MTELSHQGQYTSALDHHLSFTVFNDNLSWAFEVSIFRVTPRDGFTIASSRSIKISGLFSLLAQRGREQRHLVQSSIWERHIALSSMHVLHD